MATTPLFNIPIPSAADAVIPPQLNIPVQPTSAGSVNGGGDKYVEKDPKHKGFAGVARDILGTLGDFLLTRLHMPAMYGPSQKTRKLAAAEAGIDTDPTGAIARVTSLDPVFGAKLRDQQIDNNRLQGNADALREARDSRVALAQEAARNKNRLISLSYLNTLTRVPEKDRSSTYSAIRSRIIAQNPDMSAELPDTYDPVATNGLLDSGVPLGLQRGQALTAEKIDNQAEQFDRRDTTVRRGQDISSGDRRRGQDITERGSIRRDGTTRRGQDLREGDAVRRDTTTKDIAGRRDTTTRRGQDMRLPFVPDPNKIYIQGGRKYKYVNGKPEIQS